MYNLKPYYDSSAPVDLPTCMYRIQSIHDTSLPPNKNEEVDVTPNSAVVELEKRQEEILRRLQRLKTAVDELAQRNGPVGAASAIKSDSVASNATCLEDLCGGAGGVLDVVVSADPRRPPLSLFVLCRWLAAHYRVAAASHVHSSLGGDVAPAGRGTYGADDGAGAARWSAQLVFTVIWRDLSCGEPSMTVSAVSHVPVSGESVIARFMARLLPRPYDGGDDAAAATETDAWVDQADALRRGGKEAAAVGRAMNARLGRHRWLVGDEVSLADVVVWAAARDATDGRTDNVQRWLDACAALPMFEAVERAAGRAT